MARAPAIARGQKSFLRMEAAPRRRGAHQALCIAREDMLRLCKAGQRCKQLPFWNHLESSEKPLRTRSTICNTLALVKRVNMRLVHRRCVANESNQEMKLRLQTVVGLNLDLVIEPKIVLPE